MMQALTRLGQTGFNAYSINMDYRTACHVDGKNVKRSLSALIILETGEDQNSRFHGGLYMLPQFRLALEVRQGTVVFHRSDHDQYGCAALDVWSLEERLQLYSSECHVAQIVPSSR